MDLNFDSNFKHLSQPPTVYNPLFPAQLGRGTLHQSNLGRESYGKCLDTGHACHSACSVDIEQNLTTWHHDTCHVQGDVIAAQYKKETCFWLGFKWVLFWADWVS